METLSFPRYNVADLLVHIRNKILTGPEGKNLSKSDLYPNPKVRGCAGGCWMLGAGRVRLATGPGTLRRIYQGDGARQELVFVLGERKLRV